MKYTSRLYPKVRTIHPKNSILHTSSIIHRKIYLYIIYKSWRLVFFPGYPLVFLRSEHIENLKKNDNELIDNSIENSCGFGVFEEQLIKGDFRRIFLYSNKCKLLVFGD